jgi:pyruvate formate lyase activating enzyme
MSMISRREILKTMAAAAGATVCCKGRLFSQESKGTHPAKYWHRFGDDIQCELCPHGCILNEGRIGVCRSRKNKSGSMVTLGYGYPCAMHTDPIEKKPLYHFLPGSRAYSIAIAGCNLRCKNCQNYTISQVSPLETDVPYRPPPQIVDEANKEGTQSIAYTYSEPTVWIEYMYDTAKLARRAGIKNVLVSCGYINPEPLGDLAQYIDGMHIDLKSFDETIYRNLNAGTLKPVLDTILNAKKKGVWVEIVNLVVPQWSDNLDMIRRMCAWIRENVGVDTPLHFSRFFPLYQLADLYPTPEETLLAARKAALGEKLNYVYVGNVPDVDSNTYCPKCKNLLIEREGYLTKVKGMKGAHCGKCGLKIPGVWEA